MTEPPQPPNQPPPPSGYGHLPGPPQQPGYGYPQAADNPYAQQAPQPQQPQQAPQPQPGYAYPPPPQGMPGMPGMPPGPPQGAPGAPPKKNRTTVLIAASVAGVLLLGTGGYFAFLKGDGDDLKPPVAQSSAPVDAKPSASASADTGDGSGNGSGEEGDLNAGRKQGEDKVLWFKSSKIDGPGSGVGSKGQWVVGDTVAKSVWKSLVGYSVTDGKEKWKLDFPTEVCAVSGQTTADGKTIILIRESDSDIATCNQMKMIDLKTGKEGWTKEVAKEGAFDIISDASLTITGDVVAVNRLIKSSVYKISTGDRLFSGNGPEGCQPSAYAAGNNKLIAIATCRDEDRTVEVQDADPATGKKTWSYRLPKGFEVNSVYSVDPIVLDVGNEKSKERSILVLGPDGKRRTGVSGEGSFAVNCGQRDRTLQGCGTSVVDSNTLYLATSPEAGTANEIVAFDLGTGKVKWRTPAGDKRTLEVLKAADGKVIAYRKAEYEQGGEIISIPAAGGQPTALLRHPSGPAAPIESSFFSPNIDYVDGRFFISASRLSAKGKDEKLLMVFGK
ncbi:MULTISPECIES: PQQ-binding-like beta-propeller repeat protein [unclassified Streptomyces]|uniref:outer membrane protein assembly factor BamB family protein n=1 Tax=unclassified Streptomyces TaxID=2593676 RepID=UPI001BEC6954|nr:MULTISPECIES: PQQ-binding-like beta-propeller repeat protein [unclassified Streptomyces]MBT2404466.1 PQQ-binding-like beta-propeller repeat protein [Streptomyces sp. ISL-21]MBT2608755.1 PQQ-binding-like beta-propeller repeat protein [Streptomyces sp. ISL-87]